MSAEQRSGKPGRGERAPGDAATASDRVYRHLRSDIAEGRYPPGTHLGEADVALALGVSRTPVREAIRRLDADGWVELKPNRGAFVIAWHSELDETFHLRALLEGYGASLAAQRITPEELNDLDALAEAMDAAIEAGSLEDFRRSIEQFHQVVSGSARNQQLSALLRGIIDVPAPGDAGRCYHDAALRTSVLQHRELIRALRSRDSTWARHLMSAHILGNIKAS